MIYYIYHIPERKKIGTTIDLDRRMSQHKWTGPYEILEEHTDIYEVSQREIELQKEYGYGRDNVQPYYMTMKAVGIRAKIGSYEKSAEILRKAQKKGCVLGGKTMTEKRYNQLNKLHEYQVCPHCNIKARGVGYTRWHGDNCKNKI